MTHEAMKHVYEFENMDGKKSRIVSSRELSIAAKQSMMDDFGNSCTCSTEPYDNDVARPVVIDRVEQTYKEVAKRLQGDLDAMTARVLELELCLSDAASKLESQYIRYPSLPQAYRDIVKQAFEVINRKPAASLLIRDAGVLEKVADAFALAVRDTDGDQSYWYAKAGKVLSDFASLSRQQAGEKG